MTNIGGDEFEEYRACGMNSLSAIDSFAYLCHSNGPIAQCNIGAETVFKQIVVENPPPVISFNRDNCSL